MRRSVNSFDVFDTLIARRSVEPQRVLQKLEACAALPGLAASRLAADRRLGKQARPYGLGDIWQEVARTLGLDDATVAWLHDLELELEHEEVLPITENLGHVRDGDPLVSDTYLPTDVVHSLTCCAGLQRQVGWWSATTARAAAEWVWGILVFMASR